MVAHAAATGGATGLGGQWDGAWSQGGARHKARQLRAQQGIARHQGRGLSTCQAPACWHLDIVGSLTRMAKYKVMQVQLVWFCIDTSKYEAADLYRSFSGAEPDSSNRNRLPNPASPFFSQAAGGNKDFQATVQVASGRIDLILTPPVSSLSSTAAIPSMKADEDFTRYYERVSEASSSVFGNAYRFGASLTIAEPKDDRNSAAIFFGQKVGISHSTESLLDLVFQANARKILAGGENLNRLTRNSVEAYQLVTVPALPFGIQSASLQHVSREEWAVVTHFDFNTVPESSAISTERMKPLMLEVLGELMESKKSISIWGLSNDQ